MTRKLASRLTLLLCLVAALIGVAGGGAKASDSCFDCRTYCRNQYNECRAGIDIGQCFVNYENCLDYTCGPVCGG